MTSTFRRTGVVVGSAVVLTAALAAAQDRKAGRANRHEVVNVFNSVESRTTILSSRPHGARVQKGDVLCQLDPSEVKDQLAIHDITIQSAEADLQAARHLREAAELDVTGYSQGRYAQEFAGAQREIKLAEVSLTKDEDALEWTRRMYAKGYVSLAAKIAEELEFKKSQFALEQAQSKVKVLTEYTRRHTVKELTSAVEAARARELARHAALERERSLKRKLSDQIRRCTVVAPVSGVVHHATPLGPGAVVRDGQMLFQIEPDATSGNEAN